ncbi:MAG TPA: 4-alpha-glucanotransferase, partial [Beijerinckiaceae bacterium]
LRETKIELLVTSFGSELETLVSDVKRAADSDLLTSDIPAAVLRRALAEVMAALPVYRTYLGEGAAQPEDETLVRESVDAAKAHTALEDTTAHDFFARLLLDPPDAERSPTSEGLRLRVRRRFQQLTGPVMAKSLEDTLFYRYGRFVALNEVGGDPSRFGVSVDAFHAMNAERAEHWPASLLGSATHDMKRGEDLRARLLALSHRPDAFERLMRAAVAGDGPDVNDRYLMAQTVFGAWPVAEDGAPLAPDDSFRERLHAYAEKALRESKRRSSWTRPDEAYEAGVKRWLDSLLAGGAWREALAEELKPVALAGRTLALSRVVLKLTSPGAPDFYQGTEFGDFSLVDPDNRRPVDFEARAHALRRSGEGASFDAEKQAVAAALLRDRARSSALYARGAYAPLAAPAGWIGFERRRGGERLQVLACVAPFHAAPAPEPPEGARNLLSGPAFAKSGAPALRALVTRSGH